MLHFVSGRELRTDKPTIPLLEPFQAGLIKIIFTSFGQNTAEFYDKHILLTVLCIHTIAITVSIASKDIKLLWNDLASKGGPGNNV